MIHLEEIDVDNWRENLEVCEEQKEFVSDTYRILARAYAYRKHGSQAKMIYNDNTPVGMLLIHELEEIQAYDLSQILIDRRYQGKGYGTEAAALALDWMKSDAKYNKTVLCYIEGNDSARRLYERLGFRHNGVVEGNEIVMSLDLEAWNGTYV